MSNLSQSFPEISVLIPFKDAAEWLEECLDSILDQTFIDFEVIGVDDFSEDSSREIFERYAKKDFRFHVFQNPGIGIIPALELAYSKSKGKMITRMDADDTMPDHRLELMSNRLKRCDLHTVVTGNVLYFSEHEVSQGYMNYQSWLNDINMHGDQYANIYRECVIASPNWLTYRENIDLVGGFGNLSYPEDYDLAIKWYEKGVKFEAIQELTLYWREHPDRTSRNSMHYNQKSFFNLKMEAFVRIDYRPGPLVIWGKNKKASLIAKVLKRHKINYDILPKEEYFKIESFQNPQLLIAIFPELKQRNEIHKYLTLIGMKEGTDWWWV